MVGQRSSTAHPSVVGPPRGEGPHAHAHSQHVAHVLGVQYSPPPGEGHAHAEVADAAQRSGQ